MYKRQTTTTALRFWEPLPQNQNIASYTVGSTSATQLLPITQNYVVTGSVILFTRNISAYTISVIDTFIQNNFKTIYRMNENIQLCSTVKSVKILSHDKQQEQSE